MSSRVLELQMCNRIEQIVRDAKSKQVSKYFIVFFQFYSFQLNCNHAQTQLDVDTLADT